MNEQDDTVSDSDWEPVRNGAVQTRSIVLSDKQARTWALVLEARGIPCRLEAATHGWHLLVPSAQMTRARRELHRYEEENSGWPPSPPPPPPQTDNTMATLCVLLLLATFHNFTLLELNPLGERPIDWSELGNAYAGKIRQGEWWRAVTALTLHSDALHLLGNLVIGGVFVMRLCRQLGSGLGWSLILASGMLGNLVNAFLQAYHHRAVGASTAVFGAVGILAGLTCVTYKEALWRRWPLPLAGAFGLLALLGTGGENTDLGAHLWGFCIGLPLGAFAALRIRRRGRPHGWSNSALALSSASIVAVAWIMALFRGS